MFGLQFTKFNQKKKTLPIVDCSQYIIPDQLKGKPELLNAVLKRATQITDKKWASRNKKDNDQNVNTEYKEGESDEEFVELSDSDTMPRSLVQVFSIAFHFILYNTFYRMLFFEMLKLFCY